MKEHDANRRDFVKKSIYVAPAILALNAVSAVAKAGSGPVGKDKKPKKPKKVTVKEKKTKVRL